MTHGIALFLLLLTLANPAFAKDPAPMDFAYGIRLDAAGGEALYETPLPTEVYRGVTRGDLGDLCLFNAQNEAVPFAIFRPPPPVSRAAQSLPLPVFPLPAERGRKAEGLSLQVKKDSSGSIINVATDGAARPGGEIAVYLVDASRLAAPVSELELELASPEEGFAGRVSVQGSDDLEHWSYAASEATIVRLRYGAHTLERRTIEMGGAKFRYYRICAAGPGEMPGLKGVNASPAVAAEPDRRWITVQARTEKKDRHVEYLFDTAGHMPVDRIRVILPQDNTIVDASFFSRQSPSDPWSARGSSLVYQLRLRGHDIKSPEVAFPAAADRYWLMRVDRAGGGLGRGTPRLELGWVPGKLLFVARGGGPFTLAYGSSRVRVAGAGGNGLLTEFRELQKDNAVPGTAAAGAQFVLGGRSMLRPGLIPDDRATAFLWAVLLSGVALLAWMAIRLYRRMN